MTDLKTLREDVARAVGQISCHDENCVNDCINPTKCADRGRETAAAAIKVVFDALDAYGNLPGAPGLVCNMSNNDCFFGPVLREARKIVEKK